MRSAVPTLTGFDEREDPFQKWCWERGFVLPEQQAAVFGQYLAETSGLTLEMPPDLL